MARSLSLEVIEYIAQEVRRQGDGPEHVSYMCQAWAYAMLHRRKRLSHKRVQEIARLIEPQENAQGYRKGRIRVGYGFGTEPWAIVEAMSGWLKEARDLDPNEAYRRFEVIHPFGDGNGRTGKVLLNWLNRTLRHPVMPPNFFSCSNP